MSEKSDLNNFVLDNNAAADDYLYSSGLSITEAKEKVTDHLLQLNVEEGGNPLIPYLGEGRGFQIDHMMFINHKWVLVDFHDGEQSGEALLYYNFDQDGNLEVEERESLLYLN